MGGAVRLRIGGCSPGHMAHGHVRLTCAAGHMYGLPYSLAGLPCRGAEGRRSCGLGPLGATRDRLVHVRACCWLLAPCACSSLWHTSRCISGQADGHASVYQTLQHVPHYLHPTMCFPCPGRTCAGTGTGSASVR